jgi:hypothetical protein
MRGQLEALLSGNRLVLYSEINNELSDKYLQDLTQLVPFSFKRELNWSGFSFAPLKEFALSLSYSSRYEAPTRTPLSLTESGQNSFARLELAPGYVSDYADLLGEAVDRKDYVRLEQLVCDLLS